MECNYSSIELVSYTSTLYRCANVNSTLETIDSQAPQRADTIDKYHQQYPTSDISMSRYSLIEMTDDNILSMCACVMQPHVGVLQAITAEAACLRSDIRAHLQPTTRSTCQGGCNGLLQHLRHLQRVKYSRGNSTPLIESQVPYVFHSEQM